MLRAGGFDGFDGDGLELLADFVEGFSERFDFLGLAAVFGFETGNFGIFEVGFGFVLLEEKLFVLVVLLPKGSLGSLDGFFDHFVLFFRIFLDGFSEFCELFSFGLNLVFLTLKFPFPFCFSFFKFVLGFFAGEGDFVVIGFFVALSDDFFLASLFG